MTILIVDDQPSARKLLRAQLEADDHEVIDAADGAEALDVLDRAPVTAVISDALMPNVDGFRLCLEMRNSDRFSGLPFILYTSTYTSASDRQLALEAGVDRYVIKPAPAAVLRQELEGACVAARARHSRSPIARPEPGLMKRYNATLVTKLATKHEELERTLAELRRSEERFRSIVEAIQEVFWMIDPVTHELLYLSPGFERIWGAAGAGAGGLPRSWRDAVHPADRERVQRARETQADAGYDETYRIVRPDRTVRWIHERVFPVRDQAGRVSRVVGVAEDITERKKLEEQVLRSHRIESVGRLASGIAHDMNNILAPIMMSAPLLRMTALTDADREKTLETIEASARRGADLVKQLLMFGRGAEGERGPVPPGHIVRELVTIARQTFSKKITIEIDVAPDAWPVRGDPSQLHQVLLNLCVNARDAMPNGGSLTLGARNIVFGSNAAEHHPDATPGPHCLLSVTDTGTGIPPEIVEKIFDPFFTTKEAGQGTGLGLSTVLGIVKNHGGFVSVRNLEGGGTLFEVCVPAMPEAPEALPVSRAALPPPGRGELILIVDDEEQMRRTLRETLAHHNYRVVEAGDGAEASALFVRHRRDIKLVITDVEMPFVDGAQLAKLLRRMKPDVPLLVSTGLGRSPAAERRYAELREYGARAMLLKPYAAEDLLGAVHDLLDGQPSNLPR